MSAVFGSAGWPPVGPFAALGRGIMGRCPRCGTGRLFQAYLKPVGACAHCDAPWAEIRADDGPAWATILVVGHILAPLVIAVTRDETHPTWLLLSGLITLAVALCLVLLPRLKGGFIALIWRMRATGES